MAMLQHGEAKNTRPLESRFFPLASPCQWRSRFSLVQRPIPTRKAPTWQLLKAPATAAAAKTAAPAKEAHPNAAFMKALTPSPASRRWSAPPLPRTEIISKLWVYIKANNLQDAANKRMINADAKLKGSLWQAPGFHV